jgi:hypothetical protein
VNAWEALKAPVNGLETWPTFLVERRDAFEEVEPVRAAGAHRRALLWREGVGRRTGRLCDPTIIVTA